MPILDLHISIHFLIAIDVRVRICTLHDNLSTWWFSVAITYHRWSIYLRVKRLHIPPPDIIWDIRIRTWIFRICDGRAIPLHHIPIELSYLSLLFSVCAHQTPTTTLTLSNAIPNNYFFDSPSITFATVIENAGEDLHLTWTAHRHQTILTV